MGPSSEVELKFLCTPEDLSAVLAAAPAGDDESHELISVYFDTPGGALQKAGVSLRVRRGKSGRVQTLKRGEGLSREEYEAPVEGDLPDPDQGPLRELIAGEPLDAAFNVHVTRRQRTLSYQEAEIELALDQGEVRGGRGTTPICEVELELKSGPPAALFALARELSRAAPLYLSFDGKSARGQALVAGARLAARRNKPVRLRRDADAAEAFQAVARQALGQIAANAVVLRAAPDLEAVHQLRVACRRLRSAIATFAPLVQDGASETVRADLRWLAASCGDARDLDVFAQGLATTAARLDTPPAGFAALTEALDAARDQARALVAQACAAERFRSLMIEATAWVETGDWIAAARAVAVRPFARQALKARYRKVLKAGRGLKGADDAARHALRIEAKKLRYAAEAFASLFPADSAQRLIRRTKALQAALGELNDLVTAGPLVGAMELEPAAAFAAGELVGLQAARKSRLLRRAAKVFDALDAQGAPLAR